MATGGPGKGKLPRVIAGYNRRLKVEECMRRGETSASKLAARLGVTAGCICQDMKAIYEGWRQSDPEKQSERRQLRIRQLEGIMQEARNAYERSKRDKEETGYIQRPCLKCAGVGRSPDDPPCPECNNKGYIMTETAKISARDPEAVFLNIAKDCIKEIARLEGHYEKRVQINKTVNGRMLHAHLHKYEGPYLDAPADRLLEAKVVLARLTQKD